MNITKLLAHHLTIQGGRMIERFLLNPHKPGKFFVGTLLIMTFLLFSQRTYPAEQSSQPERKTYSIRRAHEPVKIDGRINEEAWEKATRIELNYEWFPGNNTAPPVKTTCLVTYDSKYFYVAFIAEDPEPSKIRAHLMDRDQIEEIILDDYVGFMIDTFNDERKAFQFRVNPLGVQAEALNSDIDGGEDWNWDIIWESSGRITKTGYTVEIAIPFKQLRFPKSRGPMTWGFTAMRSWPRDVRHRIRSTHTDLNRNCLICQFDKITGIENVQTGMNLEFDPTLTTLRTDRRSDFPSGPLVNGSINPEFGVSMRWNPQSNITLNATVNPDFSQVEADSPQLEVNRRFALFFPEKRPFFLEGSDFFQFPNQLVFTRTISDPTFGIKLTAREGRHSLGVLAADDTLNNLILPSNQGSSLATLDQHVTTIIGRYRFDVGQSSSAGLLLTTRQSNGYYNRIAGLDGFFRLTQSDMVLALLALSWTDYPDDFARNYQQPEKPFSGALYGLVYQHSTRNWFWEATVGTLSSGFRADTGFLPQVDLVVYQAFVQRTWWSNNKAWWTNVGVFAGYERDNNRQGRLTSEQAQVGFRFSGPLQSIFQIRYSNGREWFNQTIFSNDSLQLFYEMKPSGALSFSLFAQVGEAIDFTGSRPGNRWVINPTIRWKPGHKVNAQLSWNLQRFTLNEGHLFTEHVAELRLFYHFNARTFIRTILQYRDVLRTPERFSFPVKERSRNLFLQLLGSYRINAQTVLLIGFSNNHLGETGIPLTQTDRTFFIKVGYAILL